MKHKALILCAVAMSAMMVFSGCSKKPATKDQTTQTQDEQKKDEKQTETKNTEEKKDGEAAEAKIEVGQKLPEITLKDQDGKEVKLSDLYEDGKIIHLNIWATTCHFCVEEMPDVIAESKEDGVKVILLNTGEDPAAVKKFMEEKKFDAPVYYDQDGSIYKMFGVNGIPQHYYIKSDGTLVGSKLGLMSKDDMHKTLEEMKAK